MVLGRNAVAQTGLGRPVAGSILLRQPPGGAPISAASDSASVSPGILANGADFLRPTSSWTMRSQERKIHDFGGRDAAAPVRAASLPPGARLVRPRRAGDTCLPR